MPELHFEIVWPDGEVTTQYSPSTVIREYFKTGQRLTVRELVEQCTAAYAHANRRVEERYGFRCSSGAEALGDIRRRSRRFGDEERVTIGAIAGRSPIDEAMQDGGAGNVGGE